MKTKLTLILIIFATIVSCSKESDTQNCTISFSNEQKNVWTSSAKDVSATKDIYYVLDENNLCQTAAKTNHGVAGNAEKLLALGRLQRFLYNQY